MIKPQENIQEIENILDRHLHKMTVPEIKPVGREIFYRTSIFNAEVVLNFDVSDVSRIFLWADDKQIDIKDIQPGPNSIVVSRKVWDASKNIRVYGVSLTDQAQNKHG